jgi:hypothetical protein
MSPIPAGKRCYGAAARKLQMTDNSSKRHHILFILW